MTDPAVVAITGAGGFLASLLIPLLEADDDVARIVGTDVQRRPDGAKLCSLVHDVREPCADLYRRHRVDTVVHLAFVLRPVRDLLQATQVNVEGTRTVLAACAAAGVRRLIYLSSTSSYGARRDNPEALTEAEPLRPRPTFQYAWEKAVTERMCLDYAAEHPETTVCVARAAPVLGPHPENWIGKTMLKRARVRVLGYDPPLQYVHDGDMARALHTLVRQPLAGPINIGGAGTIKYSEVAQIAGHGQIALPAPLLYPLTELAWRLGLQSQSPASGLDYIRYRWVASSRRLRTETGFSFRHTAREAVEDFAAALRAAAEL